MNGGTLALVNNLIPPSLMDKFTEMMLVR